MPKLLALEALLIEEPVLLAVFGSVVNYAYESDRR